MITVNILDGNDFRERNTELLYKADGPVQGY